MTTPSLSLQLYSVREALAADAPGTLARLAEIGFRAVEAYGFTGDGAPLPVETLRPALDAVGLSARSGHASLVSDDAAARLERTLDDAAALGCDYVFDPFVAPQEWEDADGIARTADRLNAAAEAAAPRGIRVGYHNHSQEFHHTVDGLTAYEAFAARLHPDVVLELDLYWAQIAGQSLPQLLGRLGERVVAAHVKDGPQVDDPFLPGSSGGDLGQVPAGQGAIALTAALDAAPALELAVVEFDSYDGDILAAVAASASFLAERGIR